MRTQTYNYLIRKWTLNHLANLAKWLVYVLSTHVYGASTVCFSHITYMFRVNVMRMGYDKRLCDMIKTHRWQDIRAFDIQHCFNKNVLLCLELKDMFQLNTSESKN